MAADKMTIDWRKTLCPACSRALVYELAPPSGAMMIGLYKCRSGHEIGIVMRPVFVAG